MGKHSLEQRRRAYLVERYIVQYIQEYFDARPSIGPAQKFLIYPSFPSLDLFFISLIFHCLCFFHHWSLVILRICCCCVATDAISLPVPVQHHLNCTVRIRHTRPLSLQQQQQQLQHEQDADMNSRSTRCVGHGNQRPPGWRFQSTVNLTLMSRSSIQAQAHAYLGWGRVPV